MVATSAILKSLYPQLFHVICVVCLLYNCTMKIIAHLFCVEDADQLIANVKSATGKNQTRQPKCNTFGFPTQPDVTTWVIWLNADVFVLQKIYWM